MQVKAPVGASFFESSDPYSSGRIGTLVPQASVRVVLRIKFNQ